MRIVILSFLSAVLTVAGTDRLGAEPKRLLVVSATLEFRHLSIPHGEQMLRQLAAASDGEFSLILMSDSPDYPDYGKSGQDPAAFAAQLRRVFDIYLNPEALGNYDGIVFLSTTGELPIPNLPAFLDWIAAGHAFIGLHAAADTLHGSPAYLDMLGAEFADHPGDGMSPRRIVSLDPDHPATKGWGKERQVVDEFYQFNRFDPSRVHLLLEMDYQGRMLPVSWTRAYGRGRVFYTSLGHRDDVMLPDIPSQDYGGRKLNENAVAAAYQQHVLGGIRWALGVTDAP